MKEKKAFDIGGRCDAEEALIEAERCISKVQYLINEIWDKYSPLDSARPNTDAARRINDNMCPGFDQEVTNSATWLNHYSSIMLLIDMMEDYSSECKKRVTEALVTVGNMPHDEPTLLDEYGDKK